VVVGKLYHEYEIRDTATNKIVDTIYIPEDTETKGWVLGIWYMETQSNRPFQQIKSKNNLQIATYKGHHINEDGGDLF
jgi:hypothetical protein